MRVVGPDLHRERPLAGGGQHLDRVEQLGGLVDAAQAAQAGGGEDDGVEPALGDGAQAGVDVAAQAGDHQAEAERLELRAPAGRPGADGGAGGQLAEGEPVAGDERVARVLAGGHGGDGRRGIRGGGQVLERVHGEVDPAVGEGGAQRGDEHAGAAELGERGGAVEVALGAHLDELDLVAERAQPVGHPGGLGGGEGGAAGAEAQRGHASSPGSFGGAETSETSRGSRSNSSDSARA